MGVPTPVIPTFTDGMIVHASDLNALASNLTNLYTYNQAGFTTQRPCVIAKQTSGQTLTTNLDTLINFQSAAINTDNMWTAGTPNQFLIQHAGIYWIFSQTKWPPSAAGFGLSSSILVNGTNAVTNSVATQLLGTYASGSGPSTQCGVIVNLAAGATVYLNGWQNTGSNQTLATGFGGTFLGAVFLTPST